MKQCGTQCTAWPSINEAKEMCSSTWKWNITKERISDYRGYIHIKNVTQATGAEMSSDSHILISLAIALVILK